MMSRSVLLALASVVTLLFNGAAAQGSIDNSKEANLLMKQAVQLDGTYTITAYTDAKKLTFFHNDQSNIFPTLSTVEHLIANVPSDLDAVSASTSFLLSPSKDDSTVRIANEQSLRCLSSQWNFPSGFDGFGVAYACAVGPGGIGGSLETNKQWFKLVPVGLYSDVGGHKSFKSDEKSSSSSSSDEHASSKDYSIKSAATTTGSTSASGGCPKPPDWVFRNAMDDSSPFIKAHPQCAGTGEAPKCAKDATWLKEHSAYIDLHPECKGIVSSRMVKRSHKELSESLKKRGGDGLYYIILLDHAQDMTTRAISSEATTAFAGAQSALIKEWSADDTTLMWTFASV